MTAIQENYRKQKKSNGKNVFHYFSHVCNIRKNFKMNRLNKIQWALTLELRLPEAEGRRIKAGTGEIWKGGKKGRIFYLFILFISVIIVLKFFKEWILSQK